MIGVWGNEVVVANGGRQWSGGVRSLGSGAFLHGFVSLLWVLGLLGKLISATGCSMQEADSKMRLACRSFILVCSWSNT